MLMLRVMLRERWIRGGFRGEEGGRREGGGVQKSRVGLGLSWILNMGIWLGVACFDTLMSERDRIRGAGVWAWF